MKIIRIRRIAISFWLVLILSATGCATTPAAQSGDQPQGNISVSGAFALYPMMTRWAEEYQKIHPGVRFDISAGGAGKGMADTLAGAVDIGMVSREITPEEQDSGAFWVAVTKDAVFPMINAQNPVIQELLAQGVTQGTFAGIFMSGEIQTWGQVIGQDQVSDPIHVYTRSDAAGAPETWAKYLGGKQEDLLGIGVFGDPGLADAVARDPLGIGYNNLNYAYDPSSGQPVAGLITLPIDINANGQADPEEVLETKSDAVAAIANGHYPSPPARLLNLVTLGQPSGVAREFILWVLGDGQGFVDQAGYIPLTADQLAAERVKLP
jgi:phosphate transport system substrate-binding protein